MGIFALPEHDDCKGNLEAALSNLVLYQEHKYDYLLNDLAKDCIRAALKHLEEKQDQLDSVMHEFCPERMTKRQKKEFKRRTKSEQGQ